jgi:hypothetical protein
MIAAGASPKTLQKVLGHRNAAFSPFTGISSTLAWTRWPIGSTLFLSIPIVQAATVIPVPPVGSLRLFVVQSIKFDFEGCLPFLFGIK